MEQIMNDYLTSLHLQVKFYVLDDYNFNTRHDKVDIGIKKIKISSQV